MSAVRMFVAHFGREVLIDADHPLAIEQRALNALAASIDPPTRAEIRELARLVRDGIDREFEIRTEAAVLGAGGGDTNDSTRDGALGAALTPEADSGESVQAGRHPAEPPPPPDATEAPEAPDGTEAPEAREIPTPAEYVTRSADPAPSANARTTTSKRRGARGGAA